MQQRVFVLKNSSLATIPTRGSQLAAGYDLYSAEDAIIPPRDRKSINTHLSIELPDGCYGRIASRSGLAFKDGIEVGAGVVDRDFTGSILVLLYNHSSKEFRVKCGDRIAQIICERNYEVDFVERSDGYVPAATQRGSSGFGSSGGF